MTAKRNSRMLAVAGRGFVSVHIATLLTQVTDARFNPRAGFSRYYLNGGYDS